MSGSMFPSNESRRRRVPAAEDVVSVLLCDGTGLDIRSQLGCLVTDQIHHVHCPLHLANALNAPKQLYIIVISEVAHCFS